MSTGDAYWIGEMIAIIDRSRDIVERGEVAFFDEHNTVEFLAARMVVVELDVAAEQVSNEFKHANTDLPWDELARTRDKYAHHYADIDRGVVWALLAERLPTLADDLRWQLHAGK